MSTDETSSARSALSRAAAILATIAVGPQRPLDHLETIAAVRWMLDHAEGSLADAAYREGASFAAIGRARGTSRQTERTMHERRAARRNLTYEQQFDRYFDILDSQRAERVLNEKRRNDRRSA